MAEQAQSTQSKMLSWKGALEHFRGLMGNYGNLSMDAIYSAWGRAIGYWANQPNVQNARVKAINPLPADFTKEELGEFLRNPQNSELPLQQVSEGLKWTNYSWFKTIKSYQDMLTFHKYAKPNHITKDEAASDSFLREHRLVDKLLKETHLKAVGHEIAGQALSQGKVCYVPRYSVDKSHNTVNTFFMQELPKAWTTIIGLNNISKYTVSFNLMYFMQPGTDYRQFGDLFEPYMKDFSEWIEDGKSKAQRRQKFVYASRNNERIEGVRDVWQQNGKWFYYVSLPIDRVWTFEIDDTTPIVATPFTGLMQTYAQQSDYEAAQLSLIMNPLIKIFTGEIPYYSSDTAKEDDGFRLSVEMRAVFEAFWNKLMEATNTGGTAFYTAPVQNIHGWDYPEASNANDISKKFLEYGMAKSGLESLIATIDRPTEEMVKAAEKLEPRFAQPIYRTFEKMLNYILNDQLSLRYSWSVHIFGDIYSDEQTRADCLKLIDKGSISAYLKLCALDDISLLDMVSMTNLVSASGLLEELSVPPTAFTQSSKSQPKSDTNGAPTKTEQQKQEDSTIESGDEE